MITDQVNNPLYIASPPKRLISLVPSLTELLIDLGLEDRVVGVTKFCVHPSRIRKTKSVVGGTKHVKFDNVKELAPDLILCNKEENTQEIVENCEQIAPTYVSDIVTLNDLYALIQDLGVICGIQEKSTALVRKLTALYDAFRKESLTKPQIPVAYFIWQSPYMVAGHGTFIHQMLLLCNFKNVFENRARYPEIQLDEIPEETAIILLSSEPFPFSEKHVSRFKESLPTKKIAIVNGEYFSWYGSRLLKAIDYFKRLRIDLDD
ncbi:MAG: cobalamin-binding protein [Flavobacteriaceae bacterium]|nr:cobalamin-binding protein [Flavobacteriaceae bacterium]|tara:strand:+ start:5573 stop:6361 length:789 start_codon:yes stop_codon:yes gene_type:complete